MKRKKYLCFCLAFLLLFSTIGLSGCTIKEKLLSFIHKESSSGIFTIGEEKCSTAEAKMILLNYQKEYSSLYGINVWEHEQETDENADLESYVKDLTIAQLAKIITLNVIADDQNISLSSSEKTTAEKAASAYYNSLDADEIAFLGADETTVEKLFQRYALASKIYDIITEDVDTEVSDAEARIAVVDEICTSDEASASAALEELNNGADFQTTAATYSESGTYELNVNPTSFSTFVVDQIFNLSNGTYSDVISETDGNYYIFYCVNSYDPELTENYKSEVLKQRKEDAVSEIYEEYVNATSSSLDEEAWEEIHVDNSLPLTGDSFFDVYSQYFDSSEAFKD